MLEPESSTGHVPENPAPVPSGPPPFVPSPFGKYYLVDRVAIGGMAELFTAKTFSHGGFEKTLVIKRILSRLTDNEDFVRMFIDEAKLSVLLTHPNIVQVYDFGKIGDHYFIAMEAVDGRDLKTILRRLRERGERLGLQTVLWVAQQAARGLDYAHRKRDATGRELNIVHRDVSPSNLLLSYEGALKLVDFGIAKAAGTTYDTHEGVLKGKFEYMSPEQAWGRAIDRRSDIYSLGIVLWEMLTNSRLFKGDSDLGTLERIRQGLAPSPRTVVADLPDRVEAVVMRALAADPADRYPDAATLANELRDLILPETSDQVGERVAVWLTDLFREDIGRERARMEQNSQDALQLLSVDDDVDLDEDAGLDAENDLALEPLAGDEAGRLEGAAGIVAHSVQDALPAPPLARGGPAGPVGVRPLGVDPSLGRPTPAPAVRPEQRKGSGAWIAVLLTLVGIAAVAFLMFRPRPGVAPDADPVVVPAVDPASDPASIPPVQVPTAVAVEPDPPPPVAAQALPEPAPGVAAVVRAPLASPRTPRTAPEQPAASIPSAPLPAPAASPVLVIESRPARAEVRVDGRSVGRTPVRFADGKPGQAYSIELIADGYEAEQFSQDFPETGTLRVSRTLAATAAVAPGKLSVRVAGGYADLFIDGKPRGRAPTQLSLAPGTYTVRLVNAAARFDDTAQVTVEAGQTAVLNRSLPE